VGTASLLTALRKQHLLSFLSTAISTAEQEFATVSMTNATVLKHVEDTVSTYTEEQQLDAAMSEKIAKYGLLLLSIHLHSLSTAQYFPAALLA